MEYQKVATSVFSGPSENIAILTIEVENSGKRELEDLSFVVEWEDATLRESKVSGLPKGKFAESNGSNSFTIESDFLNPTEKIKTDLLLALAGRELIPPTIDIRAKGLVGKERVIGEEEKQTKFSSITLAVVTALLVALVFIRKITGSLKEDNGYTTSHCDDPRDVVAYVLDVHGLHTQATSLRKIPRNISYWSITDDLTQEFLEEGNFDQLRQLAAALEDLMDYAEVEDTTCFLINYDLARIYFELGEIPKSKSCLNKSYEGNHEVIAKRIALIPALQDLHKQQKQEG